MSKRSLSPFLNAVVERAVGRVGDGAFVRAIREVRGGDGGANRVFAVDTSAGAFIVKARVDVTDDAAGEARVLGWLNRQGPGPWPRVFAPSSGPAHATLSMLLAEAAHRGDYGGLRNLEPARTERVGGVIVMERVPGAVVSGDPAAVADDVVAAAAGAVAALSRRRVNETARLPRLSTGSSVPALAGTAHDLLAALRHDVGDARDKGLLALSRAAKRAIAEAERRHPGTRVRALCHGDLRLHNVLLDDDGGARLIDFEHAGTGDPAVDLAFMAVRTPLTAHQELVLLDAYVEATALRRAAAADVVERYFAVKPLCAVVGAVAGLLDLRRVADGQRVVVTEAEETASTSIAAYLERRRDACRAELRDVVGDAADRLVDAVRVRAEPPAPRRPSKPRVRTVAIDGTAASGKSVVARAVAAHFGLPHYNTGAAYRFVALLALELKARPNHAGDVEEVLRRLRRARVRLSDDGALFVGRRRLDDALGVWEIDAVVARFARLAAVRRAVNDVIHVEVAAGVGVMEGRDVTSQLWSDARHRFFLSAQVAERARRVVQRLGRAVSHAAVVRALSRRDRLDEGRALDPLVAGPGVVVIDTSREREAAVIARVVRHIEGA